MIKISVWTYAPSYYVNGYINLYGGSITTMNFTITQRLKDFEEYTNIEDATKDFEYMVEREERLHDNPYRYYQMILYGEKGIVKKWQRR